MAIQFKKPKYAHVGAHSINPSRIHIALFKVPIQRAYTTTNQSHTAIQTLVAYS